MSETCVTRGWRVFLQQKDAINPINLPEQCVRNTFIIKICKRYFILLSDLNVRYVHSLKEIKQKHVNVETDLLSTASGGARIKCHSSEILSPVVTIQHSCWLSEVIRSFYTILCDTGNFNHPQSQVSDQKHHLLGWPD